MNSVWVLIGLGENEVKIPGLVFASEEKAREFLRDELLLKAKDECKSRFFNLYTAYNQDEEKIDEMLSEKVYTSIYSGCGGCYALELREVEFGKAFIGWDLD